jgi:hypothetical protein
MSKFMNVFAYYAHVNALPRKKFSNDFKYLKKNGASVTVNSIPIIPTEFGDDGVWRSPEEVIQPAASYILNCEGDFKN